MTKPEISFEVCMASTKINCAVIGDIIKLNKVVLNKVHKITKKIH